MKRFLKFGIHGRGSMMDFVTANRSTPYDRSAVSLNLLDIQEPSSPRTGFFARPFRPAFASVETCIVRFLRQKNIRLDHYAPPLGEPLVLQELAFKIWSAEFGIADVTRCNPNVRMELGMMVALRKDVLLLQRQDDRSEQPFDLRGFPLVRYRLKPGPTMLAWTPSGEPRLFEEVLAPFLDGLKDSRRFAVDRP
jgi:hypothetical protein